RVGLERLSQERPQLILLDLMMPEMDGFQFLAELRKKEAWETIPVVILTSKDLTAEDGLRLTDNVEKILQKGAYTREALLREVKEIVAQYTAPPTQVEGVPDGQTTGRIVEAAGKTGSP